MITKPIKMTFTKPDASSLDRAAFLVGMPIAHSSSPALHHALYSSLGKNWGQILCETTELSSFVDFVQHEPKCMGSGVTMPYKVEVIPYLDEMTPEGAAIGAINTLFFKTGSDGRRVLCGTNTDCIGIRDAFLNNVEGSGYRGRPGLVVGGGGTCRAAVYSLQKFLGCSPVYIINRDKAEVDAVIEECQKRGASDDLIHVSTVEQAMTLTPPGAMVSAIPDFPPVTEAEKSVRNILQYFMGTPEKGAILEMCYHPSPDTGISRLAISSGWQVIGGVEAMIGQGLAQAALWSGINIDEQLRTTARKAVHELMWQRHQAKKQPVLTPIV